jgi:hypothetical protein
MPAACFAAGVINETAALSLLGPPGPGKAATGGLEAGVGPISLHTASQLDDVGAERAPLAGSYREGEAVTGRFGRRCRPIARQRRRRHSRVQRG